MLIKSSECTIQEKQTKIKVKCNKGECKPLHLVSKVKCVMEKKEVLTRSSSEEELAT